MEKVYTRQEKMEKTLEKDNKIVAGFALQNRRLQYNGQQLATSTASKQTYRGHHETVTQHKNKETRHLWVTFVIPWYHF